MANYQFIFICRILLLMANMIMYQDNENYDYMRFLFESDMKKFQDELEGMK